MSCLLRIGLAVRALRVHVDEAHLHVGERLREFPVAGIAAVLVTAVGEPLGLAAPVHVFLGFPDVLAPEAEAEGPEAHVLKGDVTGQDEQVGPGNPVAVLLLDRPEQAARLVEVAVVRPAVDGREALRTGRPAAAAVAGTVGARGVPGHADEQRPVMAIVGRPPVLRILHQIGEILLEGLHVQLLDLFPVVEILVQRVGQRGMLMKDFEVELVGPPELAPRAPAVELGARAVHDRALAGRLDIFWICRHTCLRLRLSGSQGSVIDRGSRAARRVELIARAPAAS